MLLTNIVLLLAFIGMIGIAVYLMRDDRAEGGRDKRQQVRIVDTSKDRES
ncbi:MAG: hypothetical protein LJE69_20720 [Thiohalocapsa sp.]|jgi:hypothetical protein|nr:hypothetical protein [Thiohalocapsa sp.]MCG6943661.1 hypothetical protein [Thiohalocapsa sp.]